MPGLRSSVNVFPGFHTFGFRYLLMGIPILLMVITFSLEKTVAPKYGEVDIHDDLVK